MSLLDLSSVPPGSERRMASMYLRPIDANSGLPMSELKTMKLQFWPETISYSRGTIGWQPKEIPGMSHSIMSWVSNGSPSLSFECVFVNEHDPLYRPPGARSQPVGPYHRDVNIAAAIAWFAAVTNPRYDQNGRMRPVQPPPFIQVIVEKREPLARTATKAVSDAVAQNFGHGVSPNTGLGSDVVSEVNFSNLADRPFFGPISDFAVNYEKFYPSGAPRIATVSLSFLESVQLGDVILPHSRSQNLEVARHFDLLSDIKIRGNV